MGWEGVWRTLLGGGHMVFRGGTVVANRVERGTIEN